VDLYPNDAKPQNTTAEIMDGFSGKDGESLAGLTEKFSLAGRLMAIRSFGKAAFVKLQDRKGQMQCYVAKNILSEQDFLIFKKLDIGDIIYVSGKLFRTKTNELTLEAETLRLMAISKQDTGSVTWI
jgi:lysyl-tRNA synthetase class 2